MSFRYLFVLLITLSYFNACSPIVSKSPSMPDDLPAPQDVSLSLAQINKSLESFKGTGKLQLLRDGRSYHGRVAWVGSFSDKLRVELMGAPGQPKTGFSSDGEWLYYYDLRNDKHPVKKISSKDSSLKRFVSIAITTRDVVSLLSGRVPDYRYQSLKVQRRKPEQGIVLIRKKKWRMGTQRIYFGPDKRIVEKIEVFKGNRIVYRAEFRRMRSFNKYRVPMQLVISNDNGDGFQLDIERYWANVSVSPDMFILNPPVR